MLAEQIVWQELLSQNKKELKLSPFWVREKKQANSEIDFICVHKGRLIPVEEKSGKSGTLRSLHQFIDNSDCSLALRLYDQPFSRQEAKTPAAAEKSGRDYTAESSALLCR